MAYTIDYLEDEGMVRITNTGEFTHADIVKQTREAIEIGRVKKCSLFLVDCTSMISKSRIMEVYDVPVFYEKIDAPRSNKVAVIVSRDKDTAANLEFYQVVCANRGWVAKVFANEDSAIKWLRE